MKKEEAILSIDIQNPTVDLSPTNQDSNYGKESHSSTNSSSASTSYWQYVEEEITRLLKTGQMTPYDAEAFIWSHKECSQNDDTFADTLPEALRKKKWFHKNKPVLTIAAKSSNTVMTVTSFLFALTSAAASFLLDVFRFAPLVNLISNIINNTVWDGSDSLFSFFIGFYLLKNGVPFDALLNLGMSILLLPTTIAYTLTLPHLQAITNAVASVALTIGLNILFSISMWVSCFIDIHHVFKGNKFIKEKEREIVYLKSALTDLKPSPGIKSSQDTQHKILELEKKVEILKNLVAYQKKQVSLHKKNAWLWGASATLITGNAVLTTLVVLGIVTSSAVTMGIVPGILSLVCAAFAVWRWHLNRSTKVNLTPSDCRSEFSSTSRSRTSSYSSHSSSLFNQKDRSQSGSSASSQYPDSTDVGIQPQAACLSSC